MKHIFNFIKAILLFFSVLTVSLIGLGAVLYVLYLIAEFLNKLNPLIILLGCILGFLIIVSKVLYDLFVWSWRKVCQ